MSRRVWAHYRQHAPAPYELMLVEFAERFGWSFEYIERMSIAKRNKILQVLDGRNRAFMKGEKL